MDTGFKISGVAHGVLIGVAIFGAPLFSADNENTLKVSEVSLISAEDFAAVQSGGAKPSEVEPPKEVVAPTKPVEPEPEPPEPEPEPVKEDPVGETEIEPTAPVAEVDQAGEVSPEPTEDAAPKQAEVISDKVVEAPEEPVQQEQEVAVATQPEPAEEPTEVKPAEPQEPAAPKETTTQIVTEAEEKISDLAPARAARPKGRPRDLKLPEPEPEEPKVAETKPEEDDQEQVAKDIAAAIAAAAAEAEVETAEPTRVAGPPLSGSEMSGLIFSIQQCWNVPVGLQNDDKNVVTMGVTLTQDGRLAEEPRRISPQSGSATGILQAYEAARRALIRCQPYNLPAEKYETWREIEIVFNPGNMVLR